MPWPRAALCVGSLLAFLVLCTSARQMLWKGDNKPGETVWDYSRRHGAIDAPPEELGPDGGSWTNSIAICSCMRGENATDVREWVMYYKWLGVDHIFLYENNKKVSEEVKKHLGEFIKQGFVTYGAEPRKKGQMKVFYDCMRNNYLKYNWLAFFDIDEFLLLRKPGEALKSVLDDYKYEAGLSVHWVLAGSNQREKRPEVGGVLRHYTQCAGKGRHVVKTIANSYFVENVAAHPHNFEFRGRMQSVDENKEPVPFRRGVVCSRKPPDRVMKAAKNKVKTWALKLLAEEDLVAEPRAAGEQGQDGGDEDEDDDSNGLCHPDAGFMKRSASVQRLALFHYTTKSQEDYARKVARGSANLAVGGKNWGFFDAMNRLSSETGGICDEPAALADQCCPESSLKLR